MDRRNFIKGAGALGAGAFLDIPGPMINPLQLVKKDIPGGAGERSAATLIGKLLDKGLSRHEIAYLPASRDAFQGTLKQLSHRNIHWGEIPMGAWGTLWRYIYRNEVRTWNPEARMLSNSDYDEYLNTRPDPAHTEAELEKDRELLWNAKTQQEYLDGRKISQANEEEKAFFLWRRANSIFDFGDLFTLGMHTGSLPKEVKVAIFQDDMPYIYKAAAENICRNATLKFFT